MAFKNLLIPLSFQWLNALALPKMVSEGLSHYGVLEAIGADNNVDITAWAKELGGYESKSYTTDSIPWCGLFMAICAKRSGYTPPKDFLGAKYWVNFGVKSLKPALGDVLVFTRNGGNHVAMYISEDAANFQILGGNQSDTVKIINYPKSSLIAARTPNYKVRPETAVSYDIDGIKKKVS
jgi:uncharacterized protein (TIGR02594 family)